MRQLSDWAGLAPRYVPSKSFISALELAELSYRHDSFPDDVARYFLPTDAQGLSHLEVAIPPDETRTYTTDLRNTTALE